MYAFIHNVIAHPLLGLTFNSKLALKFHKWTAEKAWPTEKL